MNQKKAEGQTRKRRTEHLCCGQCQIFSGIPSSRRSNGFRYCPVIKKNVGQLDVSCQRFKLVHIFYCQKNNFQTSPEICANRILRKNDDCRHCLIGEELYLLLITRPTVQFNILD